MVHSNIKPLIYRVLNMNIGKHILYVSIAVVFLTIYYIYQSSGSRSGIANNTYSLSVDLKNATGVENKISSLIDNGLFIPTVDGNLTWRVEYSPHTFLITVHGIADLDVIDDNEFEKTCFIEKYWDNSCDCAGVGTGSIFKSMPGWSEQFRIDSNDNCMIVRQSVSHNSAAYVKGHVSYAICRKSRKFFASCISSTRP